MDRAATPALPVLPAPATLTMQPPRPGSLIVCHYPAANPVITAITREWNNGDWQRCRLCPADLCRVSARGVCTVVVPGFVHPEDAALTRLPL